MHKVTIQPAITYGTLSSALHKKFGGSNEHMLLGATDETEKDYEIISSRALDEKEVKFLSENKTVKNFTQSTF